MTSYYKEVGAQEMGPDPYLREEKIGGDGKYYPTGLLRRNNFHHDKLTISFTSYYNNGWLGYSDVLRDVGLQLDPNLRLHTIEELIANLNRTQFNLGLFSATALKTSDMVVGRIGSLIRSVRALRRGDMRTVFRCLGATPRRGVKLSDNRRLQAEDVSSAWLELQYGWLPLLNDVYEASQIMASTYDIPRGIETKASKRHQASFVDWVPGDHNKRMKCVEQYRIIARHAEILDDSHTLGLNDPASILWEMVPFSFVADWFIPIGTYLNVKEQLPNIKAEFEIQFKREYWRVLGYGWQAVSHQGQTTVVTEKYYSRQIASSLELPMPSPVSVTQAMGSKRVFNAVAILHQVITGATNRR